MKKLKNWMLMVVFIFTSISALSQNQITGSVIDGALNEALPGASIVLKGSTNGTSSDVDGKFTLSTAAESGHLVISFVGYTTRTIPFSFTAGKTLNLGKVALAEDGNVLGDIVIMGVADVAKDRKTPVAVSTIKAAEIQEKLGSQEFPEILNTTPSVFATKGGGGYGDSKINIRGFDQKNIAVMINGMPINDMEGGSVYWSNWSGLADVTSAMQVQRGLGSSKLAISSVGGTINVLTRTADAKEGAVISTGVGNNDYFKASASYSTGLLDNGLSASVLLSQTMGDGYVDGTKFEGTNYYLGLGYRTKDARHNFQFTFTGATQWHDQRSTNSSINDYLQYGSDGEPNRRYNADSGYLNGKEFSWKRNYYHKPVASLNWDFKINDIMKLSSVFYGSWGRGGGTGAIGQINKVSGERSATFRDANGNVRFDDIVAWNQGSHIADFGADKVINNGENLNSSSNGLSRRSNINSHDWYGAVINLNTKISNTLTWDIGLDARTYKGYHYQVLTDLLGADGYEDKSNKNYPGSTYVYQTYNAKPSFNPFESMSGREKIGFDNDGEVNWIGGFTQLEYSKDNLTAFIQGAVSNQSFRRLDYFSYNQANPKPNEPNYITDWKDIVGGNVKGGVNYNINEYHNVFANAGYYSRQPYMNGGVYLNNKNDVNPDLKNEKIIGIEAGYGLRTNKFNANVNLYRTTWKDRILRTKATFTDLIDNKKTIFGFANMYGVEQVHMGAEVDFVYYATDWATITGSFSYGDWKYKGNVTATYLDEQDNQAIVDIDGNPLQNTLYLDGVRVGEAPQTSMNIGAVIKVTGGLKVDGNFRYNDRYYANINPENFTKPDHKGSLRLPAFGLLDAGVSYRMDVGKAKQNAFTMRLNVNNVLDRVYVSESRTNNIALTEAEFKGLVDSKTKLPTGQNKTYNEDYQSYLANGFYKGLDKTNEVYFGVGRTWNFTMRFEF
ncbi:TonB-dependent receptor domain-containing protein [Flavobacterium sp. HSC-61S13]|uniref:TonB-dependent receptor n=1 Tax=Flavobacterium sp. HSC-61S13 TaxID=2910963 RepID=UPI00209EFA36|nr:TonB-dependent receptor [Flavobacterium sp. HSC-61S13]MCP1997164.1 outer membrane cobalamin receptor [Flavobacterium sp. HSC-61S13]